jgi:uncharacterized protein DUF4279
LELHVFLAVLEFGNNPEVVTKLLGIQPSESWVKGDPLPGHPASHRTHSRWALKSGLSMSSSFEEQITALLSRLELIEAQVRAVAAQFNAVIWVAAYPTNCNPVFSISPEIASKLGNLGLGLDIDIYCTRMDSED